jgi:hypothetical protein
MKKPAETITDDMKRHAIVNAARSLRQALEYREELNEPLRRFLMEVLIANPQCEALGETFAIASAVWGDLRNGQPDETHLDQLLERVGSIVQSGLFPKGSGLSRWTN